MKSLEQLTVSIIGAGNVAWHLAPALENTGIRVDEIYSRSEEPARELLNRLYNAQIRNDMDFSNSSADIIFICVPDDEIENVAREIVLAEGAGIVHTSGTTELSVLNYSAADDTGVFYPFQTISKAKKLDLREVPILIESNNPDFEKTLLTIAKKLSDKVYKISSEDRKIIHLAGVFAGNFTNHMIRIAEMILQQHDLIPDLIRPLVAETVSKSLQIGAENAQTGPAIRNDYETISKHLDLLSNHPRLYELYKKISEHIMELHDLNNTEDGS